MIRFVKYVPVIIWMLVTVIDAFLGASVDAIYIGCSVMFAAQFIVLHFIGEEDEEDG